MNSSNSRWLCHHFGGSKASVTSSIIKTSSHCLRWRAECVSTRNLTSSSVPKCCPSQIKVQDQIPITTCPDVQRRNNGKHESRIRKSSAILLSKRQNVLEIGEKCKRRQTIALQYQTMKDTPSDAYGCGLSGNLYSRTCVSRFRQHGTIVNRRSVSRLLSSQSINQYWYSRTHQFRSYSTFQTCQVSHNAISSHGAYCPISIPCRTITTSRPNLMELNSMNDFKGPSLSDMTTYLKKNKLSCQIGYACLVLPCLFCESPKTASSTAKSTAMDKEQFMEKNLYINMTTGLTSCQCGKIRGSWDNFIKSIDIQKKEKKSRKSTKLPLSALPLFDEDIQGEKDDGKERKLDALWEEAVELSTCEKDYLTGLNKKFPMNKFKVATLKRFQVRVDKSRATLLLPTFGTDDQKDQLQGLVILDVSTDDDMQKKVVETHLWRNERVVGLFGYGLLSADTDEVILTECVLDALAVHQDTQKPVLSLPNGSAMLPQEVLPHLEHFKKVTLWFDNNMRSWEACKQFANKLNNKRCNLIRPLENHPSPSAALNSGKKLRTVLNKAVEMSHKFITSFRGLRQEVLGELSHAEQVAGVKWKRFEPLNKLLKGHRRGELTVFTGPTGSGKTTFMAEYSLDLCMQGVNTLWGSFEIQNVRLAKVMLTQFSCVNLSKNLDKFDASADQFEKLPLYFMAFHGEQSLEKVLEAMNHAVYVHDIHHVIIDNLQFMVGYSDKIAHIDRFSLYDNFIAAFRKFATNNNVHVSLVIHPRKEKEVEELHTSSIFGSAKASQEADNVLILQDPRFTNPRARKFIQVTKNRFDGESGKMMIYFNKDTLTMSQAAGPSRKPRKTKKQTVDTDENLAPFQSSYDAVVEEKVDESNIEVDEFHDVQE